MGVGHPLRVAAAESASEKTFENTRRTRRSRRRPSQPDDLNGFLAARLRRVGVASSRRRVSSQVFRPIRPASAIWRRHLGTF
jgi:hypothetical protein